MATTAIENGQRGVQVSPVSNLRSLLEKASGEIEKALPKHLTPERMIRAAITAFQVTPALQECSALSIVGCVIQASQLGLELSGQLGQSWMVPYGNKHTGQKEAQFQIGWRGYIRLAFNSGLVSYFNAHEVHEADFFDYEYGTDQYLRHKPPKNGERGQVIGFYASIRLKDGAADFEVMSMADMLAHKKRHAKSDKFWGPHFVEMAKKTVIRRLAKRVPVSAELSQAATEDESREAERLEQRTLPAGLSRSEQLAMALTQQEDPGPSDAQRNEDPPFEEESQLPAGTPSDASEEELHG